MNSSGIAGILYALPVFAIGLCVVFCMLVIIIFAILGLSKLINAASSNAEKKAAAAKAAEAAPAAAPAPAPAEPEVVEEGIDEEVIAVIAAAIAAFDQSDAKLVVRSIRRKASWGKASREEQIYRF